MFTPPIFPPVGQPEGEELQTRGLEQEVAVLCSQLSHSRDPLCEGADDINGAGQEVVELRDLRRLVLHQPWLGLQLLLRYLNVLQQEKNLDNLYSFILYESYNMTNEWYIISDKKDEYILQYYFLIKISIYPAVLF